MAGNNTAAFGWFVDSFGGGAPPLTELSIENTIFVSKNGDDGTGLRNRWDKPFLTITAASAAASAGDTIYVFAGAYNEGANDMIVTDVNYYFEAGAEVTANTPIGDFGSAKNIYIYGEGTFIQQGNDFASGVVDMNNASSTLFLRAKELRGTTQGFNIDNCTSFDAVVNEISATQQYGINIRGNCEGTITFDTLNVTSTGTAILLRNLGTDLVARDIFVQGRKVTCNSSFAATGVISTINTNNTRAWFSDMDMENTSTTGGLIYLWTGDNYFRNMSGKAVTSTNFGVNLTTGGNPTVLIENCNFEAINYVLAVRNASNCEVRNSTLKAQNNAAGNGGAIALLNTGQLNISDSELIHDSTISTRLVINAVNNNLRIRNCKIIANAAMTNSIGNSSATAVTIYAELPCVSNKVPAAYVTNGIIGTNIIVDSNVARNTNNFFN